ncbi:MAG: ribonuclease E/G, partial [Chitinivibrionales bacterium]|nr:ribonuclease E/G [Chitinivibrionales bacterium]
NEILGYLSAVAPDLCSRVQLYNGNLPLFDAYNIEKDLERSLRRKVWLKCGGYILFDHAEALLAIDVNTGRNVGRRSQEDTIFTTNMEAVHEICRQLRLRDIGGLIVIDFIDMRSAEHRHRIEHAMTTELARDSTTTSLTGLSKFGLLEITRKRVRPELQELFTDECPTCKGIGWVFSPATVSARLGRALHRAQALHAERKLLLHVHPAVADYLLENNGAMLKKLQSEHGFELRVERRDDLDQDEYEFFAPGAHQPLTL